MEQDSERDYLGRQYATGSSDASANQYHSPALSDDGGAAGSPPATPPGADTRDSDPAPSEPADETVPAAGTAPRHLQVGTVVWGLVLVTLAVLLLLATTANLAVDPVLVILGVALGAGFALLAGGFLAAMAKNRGR